VLCVQGSSEKDLWIDTWRFQQGIRRSRFGSKRDKERSCEVDFRPAGWEVCHQVGIRAGLHLYISGEARQKKTGLLKTLW
jgi:hypothetical protein